MEHLKHIVLNNLVKQSDVISGMVEEMDSEDHRVEHQGCVLRYNTYEGLKLDDILEGFKLSFQSVAMVAFGIMDASALEAADKLGCRNYMYCIAHHWVEEEGSFDANVSLHNEIKVNINVQEKWRKKIENAVKNNDVETVERLWVDIPHIIASLWKHCKDYAVGMLLVERRVTVAKHLVSSMIQNDIHTDVFQELLEKHLIDPNGKHGDQSYLISAILRHKEKYVRILLEHGADPHATIHGLNALNCAESQVNSYRIYNILLSYISN